MTDYRKAFVADDDHIERNDEFCREPNVYAYTDFDAAILALRTYQADLHASSPSNERSRKLGAEDRDHLLACALTTLAVSLPSFDEMGSSEARAVIAPIIHGWLEPWQPYTLGCLPKGAVFKVGAEDIDTYRYDPNVDAVKAYGCCDDDEVYVQGDPWEGVEKDEPPPAVEGSIAETIECWVDRLTKMRAGMRSDVKSLMGDMDEVAKDLRRRERQRGPGCVDAGPTQPPPAGDPKLDYGWGALPVSVAAGRGADPHTARMVYAGMIGLVWTVEWTEVDGTYKSDTVHLYDIVQDRMTLELGLLVRPTKDGEPCEGEPYEVIPFRAVTRITID